MNLLLLETSDLITAETASIDDTRSQHILNILKKTVGDRLTAGLLNQKMGTATILAIDHSRITLQLDFQQQAHHALPLTLILALPRPLMLKRILLTVAELGIKQIHLIHCQKVEKSYWQSPCLTPEAIDQQLKLGLMQAKDTLLPEVHQHRRFKPFVEDTLPTITQNKQAFIAHPYCQQKAPPASNAPRAIVIGPEGGFNDFEMDLFQQYGVKAFNIGARIYKVETAVTLLAALLSFSG